MPTLRKNLMIQSPENAPTDKRTDRPYFMKPFELPPLHKLNINIEKAYIKQKQIW